MRFLLVKQWVISKNLRVCSATILSIYNGPLLTQGEKGGT